MSLLACNGVLEQCGIDPLMSCEVSKLRAGPLADLPQQHRPLQTPSEENAKFIERRLTEEQSESEPLSAGNLSRHS